MHGDVDGSNTPGNESVTPDSPVRGVLSRIGESEGLGSSMDAPDACTFAQSTRANREHLHTRQNASKHVKNPNSPGRSAETHTGAREARKSLMGIGHAHARVQ